MGLYTNFTNVRSTLKTLRFELIPQGETLAFIEKDGIIADDERRAEDYKIAKKIMDRYHKKLISESLAKVNLVGVPEYAELFFYKQKDEAQKARMQALEKSLREQIADCFPINAEKKKKKQVNVAKAQKEQIRTGFGDGRFGEKGYIYAEAISEEEKRIIASFGNYHTYFTRGFDATRENLYVADAKSTSIAFRTINQNLPRFLDNVTVYKKTVSIPELAAKFAEAKIDFANLLTDRELEDLFNIVFYSRFLTSEEIDLYNAILGGYTTNDNKVKKQGLNEYINLYNQQLGKGERRLPLFKPLFQQILAERKVFSFVEDEFENDVELLYAVGNYEREIRPLLQNNEGGLPGFLEKLVQYELSGIYISDKNITTISSKMFSDWSYISSLLPQTKKKKDIWSIQEINDAISCGETYGRIENYFAKPKNRQGNIIWDVYEEKARAIRELMKNGYDDKPQGFCAKTDLVGEIKEYLDSVKEIESVLLMFDTSSSDKDDAFYNEFDAFLLGVRAVDPLYNMVRNYVTRKPYSTEKIKLNFDVPQLLNGWDVNKEKDCLSVILRRNGEYYLGIINKSSKNIFDEMPDSSEDCFEKMVYKQIPSASKYISGKQIMPQNPPDKIIKILEKKKADSKSLTKSEIETFIDYCQNDFLVNYSKIQNKNGESYFRFKFRKPSEYETLNEFFDDVDRQAYAIAFEPCSVSYINDLVRDGKLYLFRIYCKDFSKAAHGRQNLHTIYFNLLFDDKNLQEPVYKLNGGAELFFRRKSINEEDRVIHKANEPILKKNVAALQNNKSRILPYDVIKDRRYTVDKFQFHIPITINPTAEGKKNINNDVISAIRENKGIYVIGVDRGERNLIYISVIDEQGKIVHQESLNIIDNGIGYSQDYHKLLDAREKERQASRQNWKAIGTIKELKEGYLSQVIHRITSLIEQYNAIIVLENLNGGFKNSRKKVEKQVYQKFEKMLIDKLGYYVNKTKNSYDLAGAMKGLQLTNRFESVEKLSVQNGFIFYVPAWNTSKIDPTTGFVNLFYPKYTNLKDAKKFISQMDEIRFNKEKGYYEFKVNYEKFTEKAGNSRKEWTLCSAGTRIETFRNSQKNNMWDTRETDLSNEFTKLFSEYGISINSANMMPHILMQESTDFFKRFTYLFRLMLQLRNSVPNTDIDYLLSPVRNSRGEFFDSRKASEYQPKDADANGAYNIARKGLMLIEYYRMNPDTNKWHAITNEEWLVYAQKNINI